MKNLGKGLFLLTLLIISCRGTDKTEKIQTHRDNVINVNDKIVEVKTDVLLGSLVVLSIIDDFLIVTDLVTNSGRGLHLFNKNTFEYVTSAAVIGNGPGEITRIGRVGIDSKNKVLWVPDYGKKVMWEFPLDSILNNNRFRPAKKLDLNDDLFLVNDFSVLNDSIALGNAIHVVTNNSFLMTMGRLNLHSNKAEPFGYIHPEVVDWRSHFTNKVSIENNTYINCYNRVDLITICDLEGNLKYNIYGGSDWLNKDKKNEYFQSVDFYKSYFLASYNGEESMVYDENKRPEVVVPSKILVFDLEGNYQKTMDTVNPISAFCVDEENKRVIAYFEDRENPLGHFALDFD